MAWRAGRQAGRQAGWAASSRVLTFEMSDILINQVLYVLYLAYEPTSRRLKMTAARLPSFRQRRV